MSKFDVKSSVEEPELEPFLFSLAEPECIPDPVLEQDLDPDTTWNGIQNSKKET